MEDAAWNGRNQPTDLPLRPSLLAPALSRSKESDEDRIMRQP